MSQSGKGLSLAQGTLQLCSQAQMPAVMLQTPLQHYRGKEPAREGLYGEKIKSFLEQYKLITKGEWSLRQHQH